MKEKKERSRGYSRKREREGEGGENGERRTRIIQFTMVRNHEKVKR